MKHLDLFSAEPVEIKRHLIIEGGKPHVGKQTSFNKPVRSDEYDAILINYAERIAELEKLVDRLQEMSPSVR